ncbi:aspartate/glutamate racemase family protein [Microbulbifer sp. OS29]|uniref:Aspartate/glutamate racemase family protein n=1 Tax=Microbulbifer okhotskensis TaxID=2926617 RepID=A0A9X2J528_9GAMM|nr:aspartate/glutamate racemase family protein [Microbulbifer okhotskensis]MCO1335172.1 aspartate/glutamate racemase family protein [Microbulbifer okhotskensis]
MKKIGLLGGMSWESTSIYYRIINEGIAKSLGGLHSAEIILYSLDFEELAQLQAAGKWKQAGLLLAEAAQRIEGAGAEGVLLCTNTMHKISRAIVESIGVPFLHVCDAIGEALLVKKIKKVGLLATAFTMEQDFYRSYIQDKYGVEVIIPEKSDRGIVHRVIYDELCKGIILDDSRKSYVRIVDELAEQGADGVILGCTEICMLISQADTTVTLLDSTEIHAQKAVAFSISEK